MPLRVGWPGRILGRNPQSVADYEADLRTEESGPLDFCQQSSPPDLPIDAAGATGFNDLPAELLEQIFLKLAGTSRKNYFAVSGVSRAWRRLGQRMFFSSPWDTPHLICHPNQLFCLSPRVPTGSRSGLLKCFVRRDPTQSRGIKGQNKSSGRRISFHLGKDPQNTNRSRFLLCAVQRSRHQTLIYLNSKCEGAPCARLTSNFLCTSYTLTLDEGMACFLDAPLAEALEQADSQRTAGLSTPTSANVTPVLSLHLNQDAAAPAATDGLEISSNADDAETVDGATSTASPRQDPAMPQLLMSLRYRARIKGLMQPRRMDVALPNPSNLACHRALPKAISDGMSGAGTVATPRTYHHRPSLSQLSSVAALERPPLSSPPPTMSATAAAAAEDALPGPSTASSQAASPNPTQGGLLAAEHAVPAAPQDQNQQPLWRRALGSGRIFHRRSHGIAPSGFKSGLFQRNAARGAVTVDESALPVCLRNKAPHWNEALRCWCLNFRGRVKLASVKNFQLVKDNDEHNRVIMQFGKVDKDGFVLDFNPMTLSAVQAFAVALTTFDSKITI